MPEDDPLVGGNKIPAIFETLGGSGALRVQCQDFRSDELAVEAISEGVAANRSSNQPKRVDVLATMKSNGGEGQCTQQCDGCPEKSSQPRSHIGWHSRSVVHPKYSVRFSEWKQVRWWRESSVLIQRCRTLRPAKVFTAGGFF